MKRVIAAVLGMFLVASPVLAAERYAIDQAHASIGFGVRHLVISTVRGSFHDVQGTIEYDAADPTKSSVEVTIQAASIDTGIDNRDKHLRSPDFFDVEQFPTITFRSSSVERQGDGYIVHGTLTMHGVSNEIAIPFQVAGPIDDHGKQRIGVDGSIRLNRQDYGIVWNKTMDTGGLAVGNDVDITLSVEAIQQAS